MSKFIFSRVFDNFFSFRDQDGFTAEGSKKKKRKAEIDVESLLNNGYTSPGVPDFGLPNRLLIEENNRKAKVEQEALDKLEEERAEGMYFYLKIGLTSYSRRTSR